MTSDPLYLGPLLLAICKVRVPYALSLSYQLIRPDLSFDHHSSGTLSPPFPSTALARVLTPSTAPSSLKVTWQL